MMKSLLEVNETPRLQQWRNLFQLQTSVWFEFQSLCTSLEHLDLLTQSCVSKFHF
ncbi:hypothetical protein PINS_up004681 [Pythium insidiosum]|nr:hypothetical protein PINS_up004681 [Pythium insidiosum]